MASSQWTIPLGFTGMLQGTIRPFGVVKVLYTNADTMISSYKFQRLLEFKLQHIGTFDTDEKYKQVLSDIVPEKALHFGSRAGDIAKIPLECLPIPHHLIGRPPPTSGGAAA